MQRNNKLDICTEELINEANMVIAECRILRDKLRPTVQSVEIRTCLSEFEDYMLEKCLEQGSDVISVSVMDYILLKNRIESILAEDHLGCM